MHLDLLFSNFQNYNLQYSENGLPGRIRPSVHTKAIFRTKNGKAHRPPGRILAADVRQALQISAPALPIGELSRTSLQKYCIHFMQLCQ